MLKLATELGAGVLCGTLVAWKLDYASLIKFKTVLNVDPLKDTDYLAVSSGLTLKLRREVFAQLLRDEGASWRLIELISEFNRLAFLEKSRGNQGELSRAQELSILEKLFNEYYPALFGEDAADFISSLNLKLYCADTYSVPQFLRTPPK